MNATVIVHTITLDGEEGITMIPDAPLDRLDELVLALCERIPDIAAARCECYHADGSPVTVREAEAAGAIPPGIHEVEMPTTTEPEPETYNPGGYL